MLKRFTIGLAVMLFLVASSGFAAAGPKGPPGFGYLYYEGDIVRTVVPPAATPKKGVDDFYAIPNQLAVIAVAPGDSDYHGGKWAFHTVSWNLAPYPLTSVADVLAAESSGHIEITRDESKDFKCPVQP